MKNIIPGQSFVSDTYKKGLQEIFRKYVYGKSAIQRSFGEIDPRPIPLELLRRYGEPDPCDPSKTIGENYVVLRVPAYIYKKVLNYELVSDPNKPGAASRLIKKESENQVLKIPVTINNIHMIRKVDGKGGYYDFTDQIRDQHGDKQVEDLFMLMRKEVIGRGCSFDQQKALAVEKGMEIVTLPERILFNFIGYDDCKSSWPDGHSPWSDARTLTLSNLFGNNMPLYCGNGNVSGLKLSVHSVTPFAGVGVAVELPVKV